VQQMVLFVYFEIYGLKLDAAGYANYFLDYSVVSIDETAALPFVDQWGRSLAAEEVIEQGVTQLRHDRARKGRTQNEFTSIDMSLLSTGSYRFRVDVRDLEAEETMSIAGEFSVGAMNNGR